MNPFDLDGPDFLVFYAALAAVVLALGALVARRDLPAMPTGPIPSGDPYLIAYLRGGPVEAARVATLSLVDRMLIEPAAGSRDLVAVRGADHAGLKPLERAIVRHFSDPKPGRSVASGDPLAAARDLGRRLQAAGLIPAEERRERDQWTLWGILGLLVAVAIGRGIQAVAAGRTNLVFLFVEVLVVLAVGRQVLPRRTPAGDAYLEDVRRLLGTARERASLLAPTQAPNETAMLAAAFGLAVLPEAFRPYVFAVGPSTDGFTSGGDGGGGGGSCGGGCGGGCGGCGG